jgi:glycerol-3-phosphate acyltransferase PlsY
MLELGFKVFLSYLCGSMNGALLVGQLYGGVDIRKVGSGNAGGTNALRTQGKLFAFLVLGIDIAKGVAPVLLLPALAWPFGIDPAISRDWITFACGGAAIFGHCYPVWFQFAGGKGAATTLGVLGAIATPLLFPAALTWFGALLLFGYVGLATVLAAFSVPAFIAARGIAADNVDLFVFFMLVAVFVAYTHRSNLRRLLRGESKPDISFRLLRRSVQ